MPEKIFIALEDYQRTRDPIYFVVNQNQLAVLQALYDEELIYVSQKRVENLLEDATKKIKDNG